MPCTLPAAAPAPQVLEVLQEVAEDKEAEIVQICRRVARAAAGTAFQKPRPRRPALYFAECSAAPMRPRSQGARCARQSRAALPAEPRCRSNALEIASALHDLAAMQRQVAALKERLNSNDAALRVGWAAPPLLAGAGCCFPCVSGCLHRVAAISVFPRGGAWPRQRRAGRAAQSVPGPRACLLQGTGGAFLAQLEGVAGMVRVQQRVAEARKVCSTGRGRRPSWWQRAGQRTSAGAVFWGC